MPVFQILIQNKDGTIDSFETQGRKFKVTLDGADFWFIAHTDHRMTGVYTVSDLRSGRKVFTIPNSTLVAHKDNLVSAAKSALSQFMRGRNEKTVRTVIESALSLKEATAKSSAVNSD